MNGIPLPLKSVRIFNPKVAVCLLEAVDLTLEFDIISLELLSLLVVLIDLSLASLYHAIQVEDALLEAPKALVLHQLGLSEILLLQLQFVNLPAEFLDHGILVLYYLGLIK